MSEESDRIENGGDSPSAAIDDRVDVDAIRSVLDDHPVRLAILFGSSTDGTADASSDVDVAVELDDHVTDRAGVRMDLLADLSIALERNDVDLALVDDLTPQVGRSAFRDGILLCGSAERENTHRTRFEELVDETDSSTSLRERFDETLAAIDRHVDAGA